MSAATNAIRLQEEAASQRYTDNFRLDNEDKLVSKESLGDLSLREQHTSDREQLNGERSPRG